MPYETRRLRGESVWAQVDEQGALVADKTGRVEIFYKPGGKAYRASGANLEATLVTDRKPDHDFAGGAAATSPASTGAAIPRATGDELLVYTDGACTGNPGPMGIGFVILLPDGKRHEHSEFLGQGTNNIAELTAIQRAIEAAPADRPLYIHTDSSYAIGVLQKSWKAKANQELILAIKAQMKKRGGVTLIKVAGHAGVPENERCDELARNAITKR